MEVDINAQDDCGMTALMYAVGLGNNEIIQMLWNAHPNMELKNKDGLTANDIGLLPNKKEYVENIWYRKGEKQNESKA